MGPAAAVVASEDRLKAGLDIHRNLTLVSPHGGDLCAEIHAMCRQVGTRNPLSCHCVRTLVSLGHVEGEDGLEESGFSAAAETRARLTA